MKLIKAFKLTATVATLASGLTAFSQTILYVDGVHYSNLASAVSACPANGCIIYDTIPEAWTSNILSTVKSGTHIFFGAGKWTTSTTQNLPANVIITGDAGRNPGQQGTGIQAASNFPTSGAPVIQLGGSGSAFQGTRIENMTVDCNNILNATGILNNEAEEKSGARDVLVTACPAVGIDVEGGGMSSVWDNIEVFESNWLSNCSNCNASTLMLKVYNAGNTSFHNISLIGSGPAVLANVGAQISGGAYFDGSIHCEGVANTCFNIAAAGVSMHSVNCSRGAASTLPNCIVIEPGTQNITLLGVGADGYTTNMVNDMQNHNVFSSVGEGQSLAMYLTGNGSAQPYLTSSVNHPSRIAALAVEGTITKGGGSFKIDHPLDPEHKYLSHSFVESPDMMNIYNGTVVLNSKGEANVVLPNYFTALNRDFRYQLTPIGGFAPLYVAKEVHNNSFRIAGGKPGLRVSWQVTGIRQDEWANKHRIPVEEEKPAEKE